jgi:alpha-L-fucosidase
MTKKTMIIAAALLAAAVAYGEAAAPADELARARQKKIAAVPEAPEGYRRPKDWKPVLYPKSLREIARDHSAETMARAKKQMEKVDATNAAGKYKATGASMDSHPCPEWFVDAKFGIFIDWGLWSLASWCPYVKGARLYPDWYELRCGVDYPKGHPFHDMKAYHEKNWGADFKRDHFIDLFRGKKFDAPALVKLFDACGAKYVVPFLKHHSGFCLWDCTYTFRDTVDQGAHRDFAKEMSAACRAKGLKFGCYVSQAGEWEYPILQDDGSIKIWKEAGKMVDLTPDMETKASGKIAVKDFVRDYAVPQTTEFIDKYDPDILWFDYDWATFAHENGTYDMVAYFYNKADGRKEVAVNDRYGKAKPEEIKGRFTKRPRNWLRTVRGDFYTDEWGDTEECLDPAKWHPWESCSGISKAYGNHWQETADMVMSEREFVIHFADIVARGGNLLLLVNLDPQGSIPAVQRERLLQIGNWLKRYGEAIYATRILAPFKTDAVDYTQSKDGKTAYAIVKKPAATVTLACAVPEGAKVTIVGEDAPLRAEKGPDGLKVYLPPAYATAEIPFALKVRR